MTRDEVLNNGMAFENVIEHFLISTRPGTTYWANYFRDQFRSRALLFAVCAQEASINRANYTDDELAQIEDFQNRLDDVFVDEQVRQNENRVAFYDCLLFFVNKINA